MLGLGMGIYPTPINVGYSATMMYVRSNHSYSLSGMLEDKMWEIDYSYSIFFGSYIRDKKNDTIILDRNKPSNSPFKMNFCAVYNLQYINIHDITTEQYYLTMFGIGMNMYLSKHLMMQMIPLTGPDWHKKNDWAWGFALKFNLLYAINKIKVY